MESKYMIFRKEQNSKKTETITVLSKSSGAILGTIKWHGPWRQYCFFPSGNCIFSYGCLEDIEKMIEFLKQKRNVKNVF